MIIARSEGRWRVLAFGRVVHECLESLALRHGYRVGAICGELGLSESYLREMFTRDVGLTPKQWMRWERMVVARRMICWELDCETIAERLGFADCNSFRREFRKVYGVPPKQFHETRFGRWGS
jgi:AraC-like DNA-binding protein